MARSPLVIGVLDLLRHQGARKAVEVSTPVDDLRLSTAWVPDDVDVSVRMTLEAQGAQLMVRGEVTAAWQGECRRCLGPAEGTVVADVNEVFERDPVEGETWPLEVDRVDLGPVVREAVLLALPLAPLCSPDCAGPDPDRFPARPAIEDEGNDEGAGAAGRDDEGAGAAGRAVDPRWAALDDLRFDD